MANITEFIWGKLPENIRNQDTYIDSNGEGIFRRFLKSIGIHHQQDIKEPIEQVILNMDPLTCESKYLNHIAYTLGQPPNLFDTEERYRKFLSVIISIYKIKGTLLSYQVLFGYFGYSLQIYYLDVLGIKYDELDVEYDTPGYNYDSFCPPCRSYIIALAPKDSECLPLAEGAIFEWDLNTFIVPDILEKVLCLVEPINMKLAQVIPGLFLCENFSAQFSHQVTIEAITYTSYDQEDTDYDTDPEALYDSEIVDTLESITFAGIEPNGYYLMTRAIGSGDRPLDFLVGSKDNIVIFAQSVNINEVLTDYSVRYTFNIPLSQAFAGEVDTLTLVSSLGGEFAKLTGLSLTYQGQVLRIKWTLNITDCE